MRHQSLILGIVLVVLVLVFYLYNSYASDSEGFATLEESIQDKTNPMAAKQNPLTNPAAPIGISEAEAATLRNMTTVALNIPNVVADGAGSYKQEASDDTISPRIDDETTYLGRIQMCKEKGVGENPFSDSEFAKYCGMCITSGSLKTGESFTGPTGVLVYDKDKEAAITRAAQNGYPFARAIPSVGAAICVGANKDNNSLPVLAINQADYNAFRKRHICRTSLKIGDQCGRCISNEEATWVPSSGGIQPLTLYLWGSGNATVSLASGFTSEILKLSETAGKTVSLGRVKEGTVIQVSVQSDDGPYVYGILVSATAAQGIYQLPIEKFMEIDTISGAAPRRNGIKYFEEVKYSSTKLMSQSNKKSMNLKGFIPVTMVESDQLAAFDCPSAPIVQSEASAELFINDVCLKPKGQGPGNYSDECIRKTILQAGCSTNGTWYKNLPTDRNFRLEDYLKFIKEQSALADKDPTISMACKGVDISTPCDPFLNGGIPNKDCMTYLYLNKSEASTRVGRAYKNASIKSTSMIGDTIAFCRPEGTLNPANSDNAMSTLMDIAKGYKGLSGIEAVKIYLSEVFTRAVSEDININLDDAKGGRKTSWTKCIGLPIAEPVLASVATNSTGDVINNTQQCFPFPQSINLNQSKGKIIGQVSLTQDYSLSFNITPKGITYGQWTNIIHFTTNNQDGTSRCPALWFLPDRLNMLVNIGDVQNADWNIQTDPIPLNQKSSFRLECRGNKVTITVNEKVYKATQPTQRPMGDAIVYASDPWRMPANAYIENLCYTGGGSPTHISENYSCVKGWDHNGDDINVWTSGKTRQELETLCNNNPNCKSYNTFQGSGGCIKNKSSTNITNATGGNSKVTSFCVKK